MQIQQPVSREVWHDLARRCPWATYFHTPAWADAIAAAFPGLQSHAIGFFDNAFGQVVLPAVARTKRRLLRTVREYKSMEPGVYGGFIAEQPLTQNQIRMLCDALRSLKGCSGRIVETPDMPLNLPAPFSQKPMVTHRIRLDRPYAEIAAGFSRGQKSNIRQALRKGVQVRLARDEQDITAYYALYRRTVERWDKLQGSLYPREFFLRLFRLQDGCVRFWLAETAGEAVAGIIVLAWRQTLVYWHGCSRREYFNLYPNNLLHAKVLEQACSDGFSFYDMGPSMGLEGVVRFKESFGAGPYPFSAYRWKT